MISKTKNKDKDIVDTNNLILKVKNIATKLIVNNSKIQRTKLLKGGAQVNLKKERKDVILESLINSKELVSLLKITTINKLLTKRLEYSIVIDANSPQNIVDINNFIDVVERSFLEGGDNTVRPADRDVYDYDLFLDFVNYTKYGISKEMIVFNIFRLFYLLLNLPDDDEEDDEDDEEENGDMNGGGQLGGTPEEDLVKLKETKYPYKKIVIYPDDFSTKNQEEQKKSVQKMLKQIKINKKKMRDSYVNDKKLPAIPVKSGKAIKANAKANKADDNDEPDNPGENDVVTKEKLIAEYNNYILNIKDISYVIDGFTYEFNNIFNFTDTLGMFSLNMTYLENNNLYPKEAANISDLSTFADNINEIFKETFDEYKRLKDGNVVDKEEYETFVETYKLLFDNISQKFTAICTILEITRKDVHGGGAPTKYKSTGQVVYIVYKNKKYKRSIYTKEKGKTKYCKMNNKYILLSKCKVIV